MKGAIVDYKQDKGYGFIRDENGEKLFFHVNDIQEKSKFLNNLINYFNTDYEERLCYVITFTTVISDKGRAAKNIQLTNEVLNNKSIESAIEVKITDVRNEVHSLTRIAQGFKKGESQPFSATAGSNGTYRLGYPEVYKALLVDFLRTDDIGWGTIDIRALVLHVNKREKITDKLVNGLKQKLIGKVVKVVVQNNKWMLRDLSAVKI